MYKHYLLKNSHERVVLRDSRGGGGGGGQEMSQLSKPDLGATLYNGYLVSFMEVKWPGHGVDHPPHLALRFKKEHSYTSKLPVGLHGLF